MTTTGDRLEPDEHGAVLFYDTETTGLEDGDRVCEIGAVLWKGGREIASFQSYVRPNVPNHPKALETHGLTDAFLAKAPPLSEVWPRFVEFAGPRTVHAHNAGFDRRLTAQSLAAEGLDPWDVGVTCTLRLARRLLGEGANCGIDALMKRFGIGSQRGDHSAVEDCRLLARIVDALTAQDNMLPESHTTAISETPIPSRHHVWTVPRRTYPPTKTATPAT